MSDSLKAHLVELKRKHRELDQQVENLVQHHYVSDEVRKLKTQKLWLKDEIHRVESQLMSEGMYINGST